MDAPSEGWEPGRKPSYGMQEENAYIVDLIRNFECHPDWHTIRDLIADEVERSMEKRMKYRTERP
jgi:hypothetical protein